MFAQVPFNSYLNKRQNTTCRHVDTRYANKRYKRQEKFSNMLYMPVFMNDDRHLCLPFL